MWKKQDLYDENDIEILDKMKVLAKWEILFTKSRRAILRKCIKKQYIKNYLNSKIRFFKKNQRVGIIMKKEK